MDQNERKYALKHLFCIRHMHNKDADSPKQRGKNSDQRLYLCDWGKSACVVKMQIFFNKILKWNSSWSRLICLRGATTTHADAACLTDWWATGSERAVHALLCTLPWKMVASRSRRTDWLSLVSLKASPLETRTWLTWPHTFGVLPIIHHKPLRRLSPMYMKID
jgi:hypothetical protein